MPRSKIIRLLAACVLILLFVITFIISFVNFNLASIIISIIGTIASIISLLLGSSAGPVVEELTQEESWRRTLSLLKTGDLDAYVYLRSFSIPSDYYTDETKAYYVNELLSQFSRILTTGRPKSLRIVACHRDGYDSPAMRHLIGEIRTILITRRSEINIDEFVTKNVFSNIVVLKEQPYPRDSTLYLFSDGTLFFTISKQKRGEEPKRHYYVLHGSESGPTEFIKAMFEHFLNTHSKQ